MCSVSRGVVIRVVEVNHIVEFVRWNQQRSVVGAIGADAPVSVFTRLRQTGDIVADPAPSSVTSVDPALGMIALETLEQLAKILIGGKRIRIVGTRRGRNVITPLKISPCADSFVQQSALPIPSRRSRLLKSFLSRDQP